MSANGNSAITRRTTGRLPTRDARRPANCMATTAAAPNRAEISPSWPADRPRSTLSEGIRTTRLAISIPLTPKTAVIAQRALI